jgi:hypothetical protein
MGVGIGVVEGPDGAGAEGAWFDPSREKSLDSHDPRLESASTRFVNIGLRSARKNHMVYSVARKFEGDKRGGWE